MTEYEAHDRTLTIRAYFAGELRLHRQAAGLTQEQLGQEIGYSPGQVSMVETQQRSATRDFTSRCDKALDTGGALMRIWPLLALDVYPEWFRQFVEFEAEAVVIHEFEVQAIPGLLQTEDYARTLFAANWPPTDEEEMDGLLAARLSRQKILARKKPPLAWFILEEGVLRRSTSDAEVMRDQYAYLLDMARKPFIRLQVLPFSRGVHAAMDGAFTVLEMKDDEKIVYVEGPGSGQLIAKPQDVAKCEQRFGALRGLALSPEESIDFIASIIQEKT